MSPSTRRFSVASKDLSIDDRRTACLIRRPTGSLQARVLEEREDLIVMLGHMLPESAIGWVGESPVQETFESCFKPADRDQEPMRGELTLIPAIPESESAVEEFEQSPGEANGSSGRGLQKNLAAADEVLQALLMQSLQEPVIGHPPVMRHFSGPVHPQGLFQDIMAPAVADDEERGRLGDERPHPLEESADLPTGFVRIEDSASPNDGLDPPVRRLYALSRSKDDLGSTPTSQGDSIEVIQTPGNIAVGQAQAVFHQRYHRLSVRSELDGGGPRGVGGLKRMTSLVSLAAAETASDRDIEAPEDRLSGNLFLELTDRLKRLQIPSAVRAGRRQRDRNDLIDLLGCSSVGMKAVARPSFAARRLGVGLGGSLGKRSGLPFLGPGRLLELADEFRHLAFEIRDLVFKLRDFAVAWVGRFPAVGHMDLRVSPEIQHRRRKKDSSYCEYTSRRANGSDSSQGGYSGLRNVSVLRRFQCETR